MPTQVNINGVNAWIADRAGQPGILRKFTEYGPEVQVKFKVNWDQAPNLASKLLGSVVLNDDGSLTRIPPYNLPWAPKLYCVDLGDEGPFSPRLDGSGWVYYKESIFTANFKALLWQVDGSDPSKQVDPSGLPYTTTRFRVSSEVFQPPGGAFYLGPFPGGKLYEDALVGIVRPRVEISMKRMWQPYVPLEETLALVGMVNDEPITLVNREFPRGCILFAGLSSEPRNDPDGFPVQDLEYTFLGNYDVEWNEFYGPDGDWHFLNTKADGSGSFPFDYTSFAFIFT